MEWSFFLHRNRRERSQKLCEPEVRWHKLIEISISHDAKSDEIAKILLAHFGIVTHTYNVIIMNDKDFNTNARESLLYVLS